MRERERGFAPRPLYLLRLLPAVRDAVFGHIADGINFVDLAVADPEDMGGRQTKGTGIILPLGNSRHSDDLHHIRIPVVAEYRKGK